MAWPPATLPTNRTNATPQNNTHPADHNTISAAINDTVGQVQALTTAATQFGLLAFGTPVIPTNTEQLLNYASLSTAAWGAGPTFTAPSGTTGWFHVMLHINGLTPVTPDTFLDCFINVGSDRFTGYIPANRTRVTVNGLVNLTPGALINTAIKTAATSSTTTFNAELAIFKVSS